MVVLLLLVLVGLKSIEYKILALRLIRSVQTKIAIA